MLAKVLHWSFNLVSMRIQIAHKWNCVAFIIDHLESDRVIMTGLSFDLVLALVISTLSFYWIAYFHSEILNNQWVEDALQFVVTLPYRSLSLGWLTIVDSLSYRHMSGGVKCRGSLVQIWIIRWNRGSSVINIIRRCQRLIDYQMVCTSRSCLSNCLHFRCNLLRLNSRWRNWLRQLWFSYTYISLRDCYLWL